MDFFTIAELNFFFTWLIVLRPPLVFRESFSGYTCDLFILTLLLHLFNEVIIEKNQPSSSTNFLNFSRYPCEVFMNAPFMRKPNIRMTPLK